MLLDKRIVILSNGVDNTQIYDGTTIRDLMHDGYNSTPGAANKAPKGTSIMLHYDRIWIGGDSNNPDSLYFSTSNVNISDPEDWTYPVTPGEANMHGGIIDVLTWDGGKIISVQAIFDDIIVFKSRNIHKINGVSPGTYSQVQVFASNGAIADKSVVRTGIPNSFRKATRSSRRTRLCPPGVTCALSFLSFTQF
jgi:hypothetical protein